MFTCLISPFVILLLGVIAGQWDDDLMLFITFYGFMALFGLVLSIPAMIVFGLIIKRLPKSYLIKRVRLILSIYSVASVWVSFYMLDEGIIKLNSNQLFWVISYSLTIVIGIWVLKLPDKVKNINL